MGQRMDQAAGIYDFETAAQARDRVQSTSDRY